jgi:putative ABC transport system permease protein
MTFVASTSTDPSSLIAAVRQEVGKIDRRQPIYNMRTMEQIVGDSMLPRRFALFLFTLMSAAALLLATIGLYGVIAYAVTQRTHEIGIRMALGARQSDVLRDVLREGMRLALAGGVCGLVLALALTRLLGSLLYGVSAADPVVYLSVGVVLLLVALVACLVPARRATRVDPLVALRYE